MCASRKKGRRSKSLFGTNVEILQLITTSLQPCIFFFFFTVYTAIHLNNFSLAGFTFTSITHMHSCQNFASWRSRCTLEAACGLPASPDLSGGRRYESAKWCFCRCSWSDCDFKEAERRSIFFCFRHRRNFGKQ